MEPKPVTKFRIVHHGRENNPAEPSRLLSICLICSQVANITPPLTMNQLTALHKGCESRFLNVLLEKTQIKDTGQALLYMGFYKQVLRKQPVTSNFVYMK